MTKQIKRLFISFIIAQFLVTMVHSDIFNAVTVGLPIVDVSSPSIQGNIVTVSGIVKDIKNAELVIKGANFTSSPISVSDTGSWSYRFPDEFADGDYHYTIEATATLADSQTSASQTDLDFTVDATGPVISVSSSAYQNGKNFSISGTVTDNHTSGDKLQIVLLDGNSNPITGAVLSKQPTDSSNEWTFTLPQSLSDGTYTYKVKAIDSVGNSSIADYNVTIDNVRPVISSLKLILSDLVATPEETAIDLVANDDITYVKTDTTITFTITDDKFLDENKINNSIIIFDSHNANIPGTITITKKSDTTMEVVFKPQSALAVSTSYYILINPAYIDLDLETQSTTDAAGNPVYPLIKKFTTERESDSSKIPAGESDYHKLNDPHGNISANTNSCINCHNTHDSKNGANLEQPIISYDTYNYCMACHDGTVAANPSSIHQNNHYPEYATPGMKKMATECTSCHDPHLTWSKENPNALKDHFVHLHNDTGKRNVQNYPYNQEIDSLTQPCETCHDSDTRKYKDQYVYNHNDAAKQNVQNYPYLQEMNSLNSNSPKCQLCHNNTADLVKEYDFKHENNPIAVNYRVLNYKKSTATGTPEDYALCFRCHDGTKKWKDSNNVEHTISNIKQYYDLETDTSDTINSNLSMHRITAVTDGSMVKSPGTSSNDGHIPCSECHETHGSANKSLIKEKIGQEDRRSFTITGDWDLSKERQFCLSCHNGSTAIYGVTGKAIFDKTTGIAIDPTNLGHNRDSLDSCSKCHSDNNSFIEAAHSPKKGKNP